MFKRVLIEEIREYLVAVDQHLTVPVRLIVIGGCAVALSGAPQRATSDIDLYNDPGPEFWQAVAACKTHPRAVPVAKAGVSSQPYNFEDRCLMVEAPDLRNIQLLIPEPHDLAIMKVARGEAHDIDALVTMHEQKPFNLETLVERYRETDFIGRPGWIRVSLLDLVDRLFGPEASSALEGTL